MEIYCGVSAWKVSGKGSICTAGVGPPDPAVNKYAHRQLAFHPKDRITAGWVRIFSISPPHVLGEYKVSGFC